MTDPVLVERRDGKLLITLNRPEVLNAQDQPMRDGIVDALDELDGDDDLRVAILRGAGRAFSAGADMKEPRPEGPRPPQGENPQYRHFARLDRAAKPLIAVLHGHAVGGGLEIALCCDVRVATEDARIGTPEPRTNGGMPGVAVHRLTRMIPVGEALKIMMTSQPISGRRAYEIGLVQEVAPDIDQAMVAAERLADQMCECSPQALATIKQIARWPLLNDIGASQRFAEVGGLGIRRDNDKRSGADYLDRRREERPPD
jgi:enoyl-CoA hydratase